MAETGNRDFSKIEFLDSLRVSSTHCHWIGHMHII